MHDPNNKSCAKNTTVCLVYHPNGVCPDAGNIGPCTCPQPEEVKHEHYYDKIDSSTHEWICQCGHRKMFDNPTTGEVVNDDHEHWRCQMDRIDCRPTTGEIEEDRYGAKCPYRNPDCPKDYPTTGESEGEWRNMLRAYLSTANKDGYEYVGDTYDLKNVCLDGWFNLEEMILPLLAARDAHWRTILNSGRKMYDLGKKEGKEEADAYWQRKVEEAKKDGEFIGFNKGLNLTEDIKTDAKQDLIEQVRKWVTEESYEAIAAVPDYKPVSAAVVVHELLSFLSSIILHNEQVNEKL